MYKSRERRHFIVRHGLDALDLLPNTIWRTDKGPRKMPHRFNQVKPGDRWISFAYTTSDKRERSLSLITGFSECISEKEYKKLPREARSEDCTSAWMIEGKPYGRQPKHNVGVLPIPKLLPRPIWNNEAITPIKPDEFEYLRQLALDEQFNESKIPLLGREPYNEQELLAVVANGYKKLGIRKIVSVGKAFPDLCVELEGIARQIHLELEVYSKGFFLHGHHKRCRNRCFIDDGEPVAVLCWIDDDPTVKKRVQYVFELRSLIRGNKKIKWN